MRRWLPAHLYVLGPNSAHARDPQDKTYRIENIRLPATIETGDGIEALVPAADDCAHSVGLEAINDNFYDPHTGVVVRCDSMGNECSGFGDRRASKQSQSIKVLALRERSALSLTQSNPATMFNRAYISITITVACPHHML